MRLILASQSPARLKILKNAGFNPEIVVSNIDETAFVNQNNLKSAQEITLNLARAKAQKIASMETSRGALILGCDSVFEFSGKIYGKPYTPEKATARLQKISGKIGTLHSGHWLIDNRNKTEVIENGSVAAAQIKFSNISEQEIAAYVKTKEPLNVAGSFTLDGVGGPFIEHISGDSHAIMGLSLAEFRKLLAKLALSITDLWQNNI